MMHKGGLKMKIAEVITVIALLAIGLLVAQGVMALLRYLFTYW